MLIQSYNGINCILSFIWMKNYSTRSSFGKILLTTLRATLAYACPKQACMASVSNSTQMITYQMLYLWPMPLGLTQYKDAVLSPHLDFLEWYDDTYLYWIRALYTSFWHWCFSLFILLFCRWVISWRRIGYDVSKQFWKHVYLRCAMVVFI